MNSRYRLAVIGRKEFAVRLRDAVDSGLIGKYRIVAGHDGMDRSVTWVHVVELPDPWNWVGTNQFLLTTGFAWSKDEMDQRTLIRDLAHQGVAAVALAVPSYLKHFPDVAIEEANRVGLPLIEIPWEIPFAKITEGINRQIIQEQEEHLEQSDVMHRALTKSAIEAESIDEIVTAFSELIGRSVFLEDNEGNLIATHNEPHVSRKHHVDTPLMPLTQLLNEKSLNSVRKAQGASQYTWKTPTRTNTLVACPVWLKQELVGVIWIPDGPSSRNLLDQRATEHAATVIALHIARDRAVINVENRLRLSLVDTLLEGHFSADTIGLERAALMGLDHHVRYKVLILVMEAALPLVEEAYLRREQLVLRLGRHLNQLSVLNLISPTLNEISVILPEHFDEDDLVERHAGFKITDCVGRAHAGINGIRSSYLEAKSILEWARPGTVNTYDDLLLPRLLRGDSAAKEQFIMKWTDQLLAVLHGDVYVETLVALAGNGFHQRDTADVLSVHPKTVQYRVNRIAEILDIDFSNPGIRFELQLLNHIMGTPEM